MSTTKSNGVTGNGNGRRSRAREDAPARQTHAASAGPAATAPGGVSGVARLDALAARLADLTDRATIVGLVAREIMASVPAESVVDRADAPPGGQVAVSASDGSAPEGSAPALVPLAVAAAHFGALEVNLKAGSRPDPDQRRLMLALGRQGALALQRLSLMEALSAAQQRLASARPVDAAGLRVALDGVATDLRLLAQLAGSAALPPSWRVDEVEGLARRRLADLRQRIEAACPENSAPKMAAPPRRRRGTARNGQGALKK